MVSEEKPHSGSRWEPASSGDPQGVRTVDLPAQPPPSAAERTGRRPRRGRRAFVAVAATGLVLAGGAGGYVLGHGTAGTGTASTAYGRRAGGPDGEHRFPRGTGGAGAGGTGSGATPETGRSST